MKINKSEQYLKYLCNKYIYSFFIITIYVTLMLNRVELKKHSPDFIIFFLNTMPNYLFGIFFLFVFYNILQNNIRIKNLLFAIFFTGSWLTLEEYHAIFSHNKYFDYYDILMSWIGVFISYLLIKKNERL